MTSETMPTRSVLKRRQAACQTPSERSVGGLPGAAGKCRTALI
jgi:hypothetical protein